MSGGGRRGEIRKRKAGPCPKLEGGTHNRRARRAAKAQGALFAEPDPEIEQLRAMWEAFGRHQRNRVPAEYTPEAYDAAENAEPWPAWIPQDWVLDRSEELASEYAAMADGAFSAAALELGHWLAGPGGALLAEEDRFNAGSRDGDLENACEKLAHIIALGSTCVGGIKLFGIHARYTDD